MNINDALRAYRRDRMTVRDGESREAINERLRAAGRADTFTAPADPPEATRKATNDEITAAFRRLAKEG